jgi:hypothetical protein
MSMLTFYINRAGKNLSKRRIAILETAKKELHSLAHETNNTDNAIRRTRSRRMQ